MRAHPIEDLAYAAGLFDGEGCIDVHLDKRYWLCAARVRVEMTQKESIDWLQLRWPGFKIQTIRRANIKHSTTYRWHVQGANALDFCHQVLPFLQAKRLEAEMLLTFPMGYSRHMPITPEARDKRLSIRAQLQSMKTKGKGRISLQVPIYAN